MPSRRRTHTSSYNTYGNVAYAPAYSGGALRASGGQGVIQPKPKASPRVREETLTRTRVKVRQAGEIAPFGVVGFAAVGVMAALVIMSYAQCIVANDQVATLRNELSDLQDQHVTLSAQYEQVFDMERIQQAVGDTMIRPTGDQVVYLDLSQPDSVVLYEEQERTPGIAGMLEGLADIAASFVEYFR